MKRKRIVRILVMGVIALFLILQMIPNELPKSTEPGSNDIILSGVASGEVANILKASCYDCHSNQTVYPWYSYVAPVSWLVAHDVEEGRHELNFSEWVSFETKRKLKKLEEVAEEVEEDKMPLGIYTVIHGDASLSAEQKEMIVQWATTTREQLASGE